MRLVTSLAIFSIVVGCGSSDAGNGGASEGGTNGAGASSNANGGAANHGASGATSSGAAGVGVGTGGSGTAAGGTGNSASNGGAANGAGAGGGASGTQPLKGVAFSTTAGQCADLTKLGVSWFYNWSASTNCTGLEFVPQIWGDWTKLDWVPLPSKAVAGGAKYLLGFNEPDGSGQANMSVEQALKLWPAFDQPGVQLGSPAVAGEGWLPDFMTGVAAQKLRVDFIAVHWYGWDANSCNDTTQLEAKIKWAEQWQRPIWITEWSCRLQAANVVNKFYTDALEMLKKHPLVVRYAWFLTRSASDPNNADFNDSTLLDPNGNATTLGNEYIAAPSRH